MHFHESTIILTKDGMQCKAYTNEHPKDKIIVKPKYIPTEHLRSESMQYRHLLGKGMNRFNWWIDKKEFRRYVNEFKIIYPDYFFHSDLHSNWFFCVPKNKIETITDARDGLKELMKMPPEALDNYLKLTVELINILLDSGVKMSDLGITNSTLLGNYTFGKSDIDMIIYGKKNTWQILDYLKTIKNHKTLRWKSIEEWKKYYETYNGILDMTWEQFYKQVSRKTGDGFMDQTVFSLFGVENEREIETKWGDEKYTPMGLVTVKGKVTDNHNSIVRPGYYEIEDSKIINSKHDAKVKRIVTFARDYMMQALPGETIVACGLLEKVEPNNKNFDPYYRVVVGYFDAYLSDRRDKEFIRAEI